MKTTFPKLIEEISGVDLGSIAVPIIATATTPIAPSPADPEPQPQPTPLPAEREREEIPDDGWIEVEPDEEPKYDKIEIIETEEEA